MPRPMLAQFAEAGIDVDALATQLQRDGAQAFVKSWKELLARIADKSDALDRTPADATRIDPCASRFAAADAADRCRNGRRSRRIADAGSRSRICASSSPPIPRAASAWSPKAPACTSTTRRSASPTRRCACCSRSPRRAACASASTRCSAASTINVTEQRAVLHVALRAPRGERIVVDGTDVVPEVHAVLDRMAAFAERVRSGAWTGHSGRRIRNVVNIGIGGSDLGPVMAYEALRHYSQRDMTFRFVSNVDGTDFVEATRDLDAGRNAVHRSAPRPSRRWRR